MIHLKRHRKKALQTGVEQVRSCSVQMGMPLSIDKCLVIHGGPSNLKHQFRCESAILPEANKVNDLGITSSSDNTYHDYITSTAKMGFAW